MPNGVRSKTKPGPQTLPSRETRHRGAPLRFTDPCIACNRLSFVCRITPATGAGFMKPRRSRRLHKPLTQRIACCGNTTRSNFSKIKCVFRRPAPVYQTIRAMSISALRSEEPEFAFSAGYGEIGTLSLDRCRSSGLAEPDELCYSEASRTTVQSARDQNAKLTRGRVIHENQRLS
jgi:hypothetical protein